MLKTLCSRAKAERCVHKDKSQPANPNVNKNHNIFENLKTDLVNSKDLYQLACMQAGINSWWSRVTKCFESARLHTHWLRK